MRLTKAQAAALERASDDSHGIAGSEWYHSSSLGGSATARSLNRKGFLRTKSDIMAGGQYAITDAGRAALASQKQP